MTHDIIYAGDDFSLCGEVTFDDTDTASSLDEFEIKMLLGTSPLGSRLECSSEAESPIPIFRRNDHFFGANIPGSETKKLTSGKLWIGILFIHKTSGVQMYAEQQTIEIREPKLKIKA